MLIDTNTSCVGWSSFLKMRGVEAVGRYYTTRDNGYALSKGEAQELSAVGINIFVVYEDHGSRNSFNLTSAQGKIDAGNALGFANAIGQPGNSAIYFAVEGLPDGYRSADLDGVRDYFDGVSNIIKERFKIGVYGDGIVCRTLFDEGVCPYTWLAQASYSFEGSQEYYASKDWNMAQILVDLDWKDPRHPQKPALSVDIDEAKSDIGAFVVAAGVA